MAAIWQSPFKAVPINGATVWIRPLDYYGDPVQAVWFSGSKQFSTLPTSILIPAWAVIRWLPV